MASKFCSEDTQGTPNKAERIDLGTEKHFLNVGWELMKSFMNLNVTK